MKLPPLVFTAALTLLSGCGDDTPQASRNVDLKAAQVACGTCKFDMNGSGCDAAIKVDGKAYWLDGMEVQGHHDMHKPGGICLTVRTADVKGTITGDRLTATQLALQPFIAEQK
jgi:hypothetical protein